MRPFSTALLFSLAILFFISIASSTRSAGNSAARSAPTIFGFREAGAEQATESRFSDQLPDSKLAEEHLRILTKVPHMAGTIEDKATADYVARKFRDAGLETEIVEYKVWMNYPAEIRSRHDSACGG